MYDRNIDEDEIDKKNDIRKKGSMNEEIKLVTARKREWPLY